VVANGGEYGAHQGLGLGIRDPEIEGHTGHELLPVQLV
jgi:hypothetical protein